MHEDDRCLHLVASHAGLIFGWVVLGYRILWLCHRLGFGTTTFFSETASFSTASLNLLLFKRLACSRLLSRARQLLYPLAFATIRYSHGVLSFYVFLWTNQQMFQQLACASDEIEMYRLTRAADFSGCGCLAWGCLVVDRWLSTNVCEQNSWSAQQWWDFVKLDVNTKQREKDEKKSKDGESVAS
jgi:hypothetical protein